MLRDLRAVTAPEGVAALADTRLDEAHAAHSVPLAGERGWLREFSGSTDRPVCNAESTPVDDSCVAICSADGGFDMGADAITYGAGSRTPRRGSFYLVLVAALSAMAGYGWYEMAIATDVDRTQAITRGIYLGLFSALGLGTIAGFSGALENCLLRWGRQRWLKALRITSCVVTALYVVVFYLMFFVLGWLIIDVGLLTREQFFGPEGHGVYWICSIAFSLLSTYFMCLFFLLLMATLLAWFMNFGANLPAQSTTPYYGTGLSGFLRRVASNEISLVLAVLGFIESVFGVYLRLPVAVSFGIACFFLVWAFAERVKVGRA